MRWREGEKKTEDRNYNSIGYEEKKKKRIANSKYDQS